MALRPGRRAPHSIIDWGSLRGAAARAADLTGPPRCENALRARASAVEQLRRRTQAGKSGAATGPEAPHLPGDPSLAHCGPFGAQPAVRRNCCGGRGAIRIIPPKHFAVGAPGGAATTATLILQTGLALAGRRGSQIFKFLQISLAFTIVNEAQEKVSHLTDEQISVHQAITRAKANGFDNTAKALEAILLNAIAVDRAFERPRNFAEALEAFPRSDSLANEVAGLLCVACADSIRRADQPAYLQAQDALKVSEEELGNLGTLNRCPVQGHVNPACPIMCERMSAA